MRHGYTLIEIIITVAITGILSVGMFKAFEAITLRSEKAKILTTLSIDSQSALDQISLLLYNRAPIKLVGCSDKADNVNNSTECESLNDETINDKKILAWYGIASEAYQERMYSGFVDMNASINAKPILKSPDTNLSDLLTLQKAKWGNAFELSDMGLVFAGTFEGGAQDEAYKFKATGDEIEFLSTTNIPKIFEKYYLIDSAYAVTLKVNAPDCLVLDSYKPNDLLLMYNFRPWNGETLCHAKVSLLTSNVNGFSAHIVNGTIRLGIDMNRTVRGGNPVRLSKQKVVF